MEIVKCRVKCRKYWSVTGRHYFWILAATLGFWVSTDVWAGVFAPSSLVSNPVQHYPLRHLKDVVGEMLTALTVQNTHHVRLICRKERVTAE